MRAPNVFEKDTAGLGMYSDARDLGQMLSC